MQIAMRPYTADDHDRALAICIAAFESIHDGFAAALGPAIFALQYHDWKEQYARTFAAIDPADTRMHVHVAEADGALAGFVFTIMHPERKTGEIGLNAVDPAWQGRGIGRAMYAFALAELKARGAAIAYVGTGGDAGHEPARRTYRAIGFDRGIPGVHLFKVL
jgi:ribosomal protein S18 acetylase RimI-like enzyme